MPDPSYRQTVHLLQLAPTAIAARMLLFPWPLGCGESWDKIGPGFFDAPGG